MITLLFYALKVIVCSFVFFGYYWMALRNKQFNHWNRFYLLASVIFSIFIPLIEFNLGRSSEDQGSSSIKLLQVVASANHYLDEFSITQKKISFIDQLPWIGYLLIVTILIIGFLSGIRKVFLLSKKYQFYQFNKIRVFQTNAEGTPFSFFQNIFWNENIDLRSDTGQQIFQHEMVHVEQKHSIDKVFMHLVAVVFWFNPLFWLIKRELNTIHEFIADEKSLSESGAEALAAMLLQTAYPAHYHDLVNPFFKTSIKRRLAMISKIKTPRVSYFSRLAVLPLVAITILSFSIRQKNKHLVLHTEEPFVVVIDAGHGKLPSGGVSGAREKGINEDQIVLELAQTIQKLNSNPQIRILLSRSTENLVSLQDRVAFADQNKADMFISLHVNAEASGRSDSSGIEVWVSSKNPKLNEESRLLGSALSGELSKVYPTKPELRTRQVGIFVLDKAMCPSSMVEVGYLTNPKDREFVSALSNREKIASAILLGIEKYAASNTGKTGANLRNVSPSGFQSNENDMGEFVSDNVTLELTNVPASDTAPLLILNGNSYSNIAINRRVTITADKVTVFQPHSKRAVELYGPKAEYGVMEFSNAKLDYDNVENKSDTIPYVEPIFSKVERQASIDQKLWQAFLEKKLPTVLETVAKKAPAGSYTVQLKFLVDNNGKTSSFTSLNDPGFGIPRAVINALYADDRPTWTPAMQNGHAVSAYQIQPVTVTINQ